MAYDEGLADRVRDALGTTDYEVIKMFGGLAFMVNTHMSVGVIRDELMLRVGTEGYDAALARGAEPMRMGERTMRGMVSVSGAGLTAAALREWVAEAVALARSQPPKKPKKPKRPNT
jgi:TfoX/Sxy family transcriptional regulator of competence genes